MNRRLFSMPIMDIYTKEKLRETGVIFKDIIIISIPHLTSGWQGMEVAFKQLGAEPSKCHLVIKGYPYEYRESMLKKLKQDGYNIYAMDYALNNGISFDEAMKLKVQEVFAQIPEDKKFLVMDDGGYITKNFDLLSKPKQKNCIAIVEQTTAGARYYKEFKPNVPFFNVAESRFKSIFEAPFIGQSVVENIKRLIGNENLAGRNALVVGFGSIGKEVAKSLYKNGTHVTIYDKDEIELTRVAKHHPEYNLSSDLTEAVRDKDLIIGSVGNKSIANDDKALETKLICNLKQNVILVSASSSDREITLEGLRTHMGVEGYIKPWFVGGSKIGSIFRLSNTRPMKEVRLLADGLPVNFYNSDSIIAEQIDPILTLLFLCAIKGCKEKLDPGVYDADQVVMEEGLAKRVILL